MLGSAKDKELPTVPSENTSISRWKRAFGLIKPKGKASTAISTPQVTSTTNVNAEMPRAATSLGHNINPPANHDEARDGTSQFDYAYHYDREGYFRHGSASSIPEYARSSENMNTNGTSDDTIRKRHRRRIPVYRHSLTSGFIFSSHSAEKEKEKENKRAETLNNRNTISADTSTFLTNSAISDVAKAAGTAAALTRAEKRARRKQEKQRRKDLAGLTYAYAYGYGGMALKQQLELQKQMQEEGMLDSGFSYSQRGSRLSKLSVFSWEEQEQEQKEGDNEQWEPQQEDQAEEVHKAAKEDASEVHGQPHDDVYGNDSDIGHDIRALSRQWSLRFRTRSRKLGSTRKAGARSRSRSRARQTRLSERRKTTTSVPIQGRNEVQITTDVIYNRCPDNEPGEDAAMILPKRNSQTGACLDNGTIDRHTEVCSANNEDICGLGIEFNDDTSLASGTSINADIYGIGGITPRQSQSITHNIAGPSRSLTRSNSQTSQSTSPARIIPDSNPATTHKIKCQHTGLTSLDNTDGFDGNCRSEGCKAVDKMYTYQNEYPPLPARHPDHHYNPAEAFCIASPSISTLEVPNTSAATQVITSQPTRRPSQLSMMGTDMIDTPAAKDSNRDQNSAYLANRCNRTQSIAAAKNQATHASSIASNSVLAYCGEEQAHSNAIGLDSIRTDGVEGDNGDYGRYANCETSATYPCQIPMRQFELQQLPSHEASRRSHNFYHSFSSRGAFELRPGESVVVIQQQTKHEGQYYHADASNVDMHQSTENAKVNLISSHERLSVTELPDRDIQHGVEYRKENREDSQPSKFNPWSSHFSQLHQDHYRQHLLQSNCLESKDPSETIYSEGKRSTLQIPSSRETTCRSSLAIGNTTKSSDLSDVPVTITSAREAPAKMLTKAFLSDREEFLKLQACEPIIEYTSYKTSPSLAFTSGAPHHAEIASVKSSGSLINQHGREYSDSLLRGTPRQDFDDMRYNPLRSHPVQARIGSRPIHPRSTSYSSVQQKHTPAKNIHTVSSHQDLQQYRRLEKSPSQPNMIGSSTSVSSKRLPAMAKGDRENIITRTLTPLKGHSFLHRSDGKKPKKSLSMTPLTAGRAPKEVTCGEKIDAVTDSVRSSSHRPRDLWKREQSTDGGAHLSRSTTTSKRVKDLHRRACVSPLKISFPNELVGDVAVPIYPGSDSTISSRLYYSCNEDTMNNDSVMTLPSGGKHSMDGMLSFSNKSSPLLSEYESSSDVPTSDEEEVQICEAKIESARRVRHRRVNAVEIKQIDIKPRLPPTPPMHPIQAPISPAHRFIPHSIPRRLQKRNMDALNRFMIRRSPSDPVHTPLTPPEEGQLSHSASNSSFPRRPVLRHGFAFRHSHSCPSSNVNSPSMPSLPEAEVNQMREHMRSASSSDSNQSSWSQGSDDSLNTFVDLKDASFNFN